jgi:diguanylate cyclase (GGDEF)-like protein
MFVHSTGKRRDPLPTRRFRLAAQSGVLAAMTLLAGMVPVSLWAQPADQASAPSLVDSAVSEIRIDPDAGRRQIETALQLLRRTPQPDVEIRAHLLLSEYYLERDQNAARAQIEAAAALLPHAGRPGLEAGVLTSRGRLLQMTGDNERAAGMYDQAVHLAQASNDDEMLAETLLARGYLRGLRGAYDTGLADLMRAQGLFELQKNSQRATNALNNIAIIYNRMGDANEAISIFERTVETQRASGLKRDEASTLRNQGDALETLRLWDAARIAYSASWELSRQMDYPRGEAYALRGLANVSNAMGDPNAALAQLDRAAQLQQQTPDARLLAQINLARGRVLNRLNRWKPSLSSLGQALALFRQVGSQSELATTYNELATVSAELGNWRDAFDYRTLAQTLSTQLLRSQLDQRVATLKVEFDTASKEQQNALLLRENAADQAALAQHLKASKLQTAVIVLGVLLVAVLTTLVVHQRRSSLRLRLLAMTDELTGVPNRRSVITLLSQMLRRSVEPISILIIDIDHFKSINDRHGHLTGDEALKLLASDLRGAIADPGFFGRLGGEEFAAILPAATLEQARELAESLRERVLRLDLSRWLGDRRITISIGIATSMPGRDSISSMLRRADNALYSAKDAGRNCVRSNAGDDEGQRAA